jgi:hypothetical protein
MFSYLLFGGIIYTLQHAFTTEFHVWWLKKMRRCGIKLSVIHNLEISSTKVDCYSVYHLIHLQLS